MIWLVVMGLLAGCDPGSKQWEIEVENKGDLPCSFKIVTSGSGSKNNVGVDGIAKGKPVSLVAGSGNTVVQSIKVVRGKDEQTLTPNLALPMGKKLRIVVGADGKVEILEVKK
jgi:hypothetical protein